MGKILLTEKNIPYTNAYRHVFYFKNVDERDAWINLNLFGINISDYKEAFNSITQKNDLKLDSPLTATFSTTKNFSDVFNKNYLIHFDGKNYRFFFINDIQNINNNKVMLICELDVFMTYFNHIDFLENFKLIKGHSSFKNYLSYNFEVAKTPVEYKKINRFFDAKNYFLTNKTSWLYVYEKVSDTQEGLLKYSKGGYWREPFRVRVAPINGINITTEGGSENVLWTGDIDIDFAFKVAPNITFAAEPSNYYISLNYNFKDASSDATARTDYFFRKDYMPISGSEKIIFIPAREDISILSFYKDFTFNLDFTDSDGNLSTKILNNFSTNRDLCDFLNELIFQEQSTKRLLDVLFWNDESQTNANNSLLMFQANSNNNNIKSYDTIIFALNIYAQDSLTHNFNTPGAEALEKILYDVEISDQLLLHAHYIVDQVSNTVNLKYVCDDLNDDGVLDCQNLSYPNYLNNIYDFDEYYYLGILNLFEVGEFNSSAVWSAQDLMAFISNDEKAANVISAEISPFNPLSISENQTGALLDLDNIQNCNITSSTTDFSDVILNSAYYDTSLNVNTYFSTLRNLDELNRLEGLLPYSIILENTKTLEIPPEFLQNNSIKFSHYYSITPESESRIKFFNDKYLTFTNDDNKWNSNKQFTKATDEFSSYKANNPLTSKIEYFKPLTNPLTWIHPQSAITSTIGATSGIFIARQNTKRKPDEISGSGDALGDLIYNFSNSFVLARKEYVGIDGQTILDNLKTEGIGYGDSFIVKNYQEIKRRYFNFIQLKDYEDLKNNSVMNISIADKFKEIFERGFTYWNDATKYMNYDVLNTEVKND